MLTAMRVDYQRPRIPGSSADNFLYDIENHKDTDFRIIGSNIMLTRRKWGWSLKSEDETKLLMANTLRC